ncbi:MAG: serine hydrolase domain-containing protein [Chthoniobacter sp.]
MTPSLKTLIFLAATTATGWCEADIAGTFSLTSDIPVVVARSGSGWTLQIGKEAPHPLLPGTANHWSVPDLGLGVACPSGGGLELTRYGKTVLAPPAQAGKQPNPAGRPDEAILDDLVPRLMIAWNVPGVSAVGIREGSIAWRRQYGVKTFGQPAPVDENTVFEACSMSKPVFAYAALKLVEEGKLDLDTPLVQYLGHPYIENEPLHQKITTRMVLDHTSGLPNWRPGGRNSGQPLVVHFEPGTKFQYSGEGIWFLQRTVEKITGVPLKDWMKSRLLDPLGMTSSSYTWEKKFEATAAAGHDKAGQVHLNRPLYREETPPSAFTPRRRTTPKSSSKS